MNVLTILAAVYGPVLAVFLASEQLGEWLDRRIPWRAAPREILGASAAARSGPGAFLRGVDTESGIVS